MQGCNTLNEWRLKDAETAEESSLISGKLQCAQKTNKGSRRKWPKLPKMRTLPQLEIHLRHCNNLNLFMFSSFLSIFKFSTTLDTIKYINKQRTKWEQQMGKHILLQHNFNYKNQEMIISTVNAADTLL